MFLPPFFFILMKNDVKMPKTSQRLGKHLFSGLNTQPLSLDYCTYNIYNGKTGLLFKIFVWGIDRWMDGNQTWVKGLLSSVQTY